VVRVEPVVERVMSVLGEPRRSGGVEWVWCCPFCEERGKPWPDAHYHLYVNPTKTEHTRADGTTVRSPTGFVYCQRCHYTASVNGMLRHLGLDGLDEAFAVESWRAIADRIRALGLPARTAEEPAPVEVEFPCRTRRVSLGMQSYRYLRDRGFSDPQIREYGARVGSGAHWGWRIFLPVYDDDRRLRYWVARWFGDADEDTPKYRNPVGLSRAVVLYRYWDVARRLREGQTRRVLVAEGPLSAWGAGPDAVATLGVYVTPHQQGLLADLPRLAGLRRAEVEFVLLPDGEDLARRYAWRLARQLHRRGLRVRVANLPEGEDPASVPAEAVQRAVAEAMRYDGFASDVGFGLAGLTCSW
jgi:hypothetical protein